MSDPHPNLITDRSAIGRIIKTYRRVAVVGMKPDADSSAHDIPMMLLSEGFEIFPVNPKYPLIEGLLCVPDVLALSQSVDIINVWRASGALPALADEVLAMSIKPKVFWTQLGIRDDAVALRLAQAGIQVIQDRCIGVEYRVAP